jgi:hypothetical protein
MSYGLAGTVADAISKAGEGLASAAVAPAFSLFSTTVALSVAP